MQLAVDNLDMAGERNYSAYLDAERPPRIVRRLNEPWTMQAHLVADSAVPISVRPGARVKLRKDDGTVWFTGYVTEMPRRTFAGYGDSGAVFLVELLATGDELDLDHQMLPPRVPFVARQAAEAIKTLAADTGAFLDMTGVNAAGVITSFTTSAGEKWSAAAKAIADQTRTSLTVQDKKALTVAIGASTHCIDATDANFSPDGLKVHQAAPAINDLTIVGEKEPQMYVKDYFVADGNTQRFYLSTAPFLRKTTVLLEEEYPGPALNSRYWTVKDSFGALSVSGGKLQITATNTSDGSVTVAMAEQLELGGAWLIEHGAVQFSHFPPGNGVLGGIYAGAVARSNCLAGFSVSSLGNSGQMQALVNGLPTGATVALTSGHRYELKTRLYAREAYRQGQRFCSSQVNGGAAYGGSQTPADVQVVLEVRDINPADASTFLAPGTVLYDGVLSNAPAFVTYGLVNGGNLQAAIGYTRLVQEREALVRSAPPFYPAFTRRMGSSAEGGECTLTFNGAELYFFTPSIPANGELIEVSYRSSGTAAARVKDSNAALNIAKIGDSGVRSRVVHLAMPQARTTEDCCNAALALLDETTQAAWQGEYKGWLGYLPANAVDIYPGEVLQVNAPDWCALFEAVVREVELEFAALSDSLVQMTVKFANEAASPICLNVGNPTLKTATPVLVMERGANASIACLPNAGFNQITASQLTIETGTTAPAGGGFEVRTEGDWGWGTSTDRNLVGRFTARTFTLPKTAIAQDYYLRMFDGATPPNYSRYSTLLHVDANL